MAYMSIMKVKAATPNRVSNGSGSLPGRYAASDAVRTLAAPYSACFGGHFESAYEQKTQQSPGFGRSVSPQLSHW